VIEFRPDVILPVCFRSACANIPDSYAPPVQRKPLTGADPSPVGGFVHLAEADADSYIVRDMTGWGESRT
jgi:hypothetical protein